MLRTIDLDQFAHMLTPIVRLLDPPACGPRQPDPGLPHPSAQRLPRHLQVMTFSQLRGRQRWTEIGVMLADQRNRMIAFGQAVVRRLAPPPIAAAPPSRYRLNSRCVCRVVSCIRSAAAEIVRGLRQAAPEPQSDSTLACSSAPHPSDPQPPNPNGLEAEIPTLLTADILALRLHVHFANQRL